MTPSPKYHSPLWVRRALLILFGWLLFLVALFEALSEGWTEFKFEFAHSWRDVVAIWKGEK